MNTFSFNEYKRSNNENQYWNTLKVTAVGSTLKFYINNILVWQGSDASFGSGLVGIQMYKASGDPYNSKLVVDSASLSVITTSSMEAAEVVDTSDQVTVPGGSMERAPNP